jgi:secretion/DNA translocation related TadE-like protein
MGDDQGAATVFGVAALAVLVVLVVFGIELGGAVVHRHEVSGAADLAALAAAAQLVDGEALACERATWVAERMRTRLLDCAVNGWEVTVEVTGGQTAFGTATVRARAGPDGD